MVQLALCPYEEHRIPGNWTSIPSLLRLFHRTMGFTLNFPQSARIFNCSISVQVSLPGPPGTIPSLCLQRGHRSEQLSKGSSWGF